MFLTPRAKGPHNRGEASRIFAERRSHVPKTLLAVDDSATMRKVLEITFGGEDFRVVTAEGTSSALGRLGEEPLAAVIDATLGADDGYALAKEIRSRDARIAVVLMASRNAPYDANRGRDAGVDDFIDKPFDTQALIEKVKKALVSREATAAPKAAAPQPVAASPGVASFSPRPPGVAPVAPPTPSITSKPGWPTQRTHTLSFEGGSPAAAPPSQAPVPPRAVPNVTATLQPKPAPVASLAPAVQSPVRTAVGSPPPPHVAPRAAVSVDAATGAANGRLAAKLGELGLTAQQAEAVLALSREVVERVVWEVVPALAETMIKEEIARITKEG
jgi:CheY-like chemotaxis protein